MSREHALIRERIDQAERDIAELAEQVAAGEIDAETADGLRERYEAERRKLLEQLATDAEGDTADEGEAAGALTGSRLIGIGAVVIAVIGIGLWLLSSNGAATAGVEGVAQDVINGEAMNLDDVTNEQMEAVVAQNPDIAPMRLALAERYFVAGDFPNALRHYMYVLDTQGVKDPTALANVGWMTYQSGVSDIAESFVEESLAIQPDGGIAYWYLAVIRFYGLNDPVAAIEPLQKLLAYDELPDEIRAEAESMLADAEALQ
jgi:cytochrome c-type biogenesis protein CcmH/NrfG